MIGIFALNVPAGLGLYWFIGNCVSIIQQSFVVGWGNVLPARFRSVGGGAPALPAKGQGGTKNPGPKGQGEPPKNPPRKNGSKPKKPRR
jgi:hypothetical protein